MNTNAFSKSARDLSRTPLGIIALFLVLVYGLASMVVGVSGVSKLPPETVTPLIWFLVLFPVLVLALFGWLVSCHHTKLYGPSEFPHREDFLRLHSPASSMITPAPEPAGSKKRPKALKKKQKLAPQPTLKT